MQFLKSHFLLAGYGLVLIVLSACVVEDPFFFDDCGFDNCNGGIFTIQEAIDFSNPGDTVFIENGIYSPFTNGEIFPIFMKDGVKLVGEDPENTIIDADNTDYILDVFNYSGFISNFTLQNGLGDRGGGIFMQNSNVTLENLIIVSNRAFESGSGMYIKDSDGSTLRNLIVVSNARGSSSSEDPAQVEIVGTTLNFFNNTVAFGDDDGVRSYDGSSGSFENNIFYQNGSEGEGAGLADLDPVTSLFLQYNISFENTELDYFLNGMDLTSAEANDLFPDDQIANNFSADPLFVNPNNGDFSLQSGSPAINAGDPNSFFNNPNGSRNTIGATGGPNSEITGFGN